MSHCEILAMVKLQHHQDLSGFLLYSAARTLRQLFINTLRNLTRRKLRVLLRLSLERSEGEERLNPAPQRAGFFINTPITTVAFHMRPSAKLNL
jgi:hypothetical protein